VICGNDCATDSAHILSNAIKRNEYGKLMFLDLLGGFWSEEHVDALRTILADPEHEVRNIIMLDTSIHRRWERFQFCLKLLDGYTDTRQELEFLWLQPGQGSQRSISHDTPATNGIPLLPTRGVRQVHSGDKVILETSDPVKCPLPHPEFFKLQYNLNLALCCAGGAEVIERVFRRQPPPPTVPANNPTGIRQDPHDDAHGVPEVYAPDFVEHLIDSALALGVIEEDEVPEWRLLFDPTCTKPSEPLESLYGDLMEMETEEEEEEEEKHS
jgi:hypothetical protein